MDARDESRSGHGLLGGMGDGVRVRACVCIVAFCLMPLVGLGTAGTASASSPSHTVAGYGIDTSSTVGLASAEGVQLAQPFPPLSSMASKNPSALTQMQTDNMQMISTDLVPDIANYACWHVWTFVGSGGGYCSGVPPAYSSFGADAAGLQGANDTLDRRRHL